MPREFFWYPYSIGKSRAVQVVMRALYRDETGG